MPSIPLDTYTWTSLRDAALTEQPPLVATIIHRGEVVMFVAERKSAKTIFSLQLGLSVACGVPLAGLWDVPVKARVLYVALEGSARWYQTQLLRLTKMLGAEPDDSHWTLVRAPHMPLNRSAGAECLASLMAAHRPELLILDPLYRIHHGTLTDDGEVAATTGFINSLVMQYGTAVWVPAHTHRVRMDLMGKRIDEGSSAYFGSYVLAAWPNAAFGFTFDKADKLAKLTAHDEREPRFEPAWGQVRLKLIDPPDKLGFVVVLESRLRAVLPTLVGQGIREIGRQFDVHPEQVERALRGLQKEGLLMLVPQGNKTVVAPPTPSPTDTD